METNEGKGRRGRAQMKRKGVSLSEWEALLFVHVQGSS